MALTTVDTDERARGEYYERGTQRALALANRGPIRYTRSGQVHPEILDAYDEYGFYVFEAVVGEAETQELRADVERVLDRAPFPDRDSAVDRLGRRPLGHDKERSPFRMAAPLSDPVGGTNKNNGRHPVKMYEPAAPAGAPEDVPYVVSGCLEHMDSCLRVYGHPDLLRVAEAVNGPDFTPFTEVLFVKMPGLGPSVAWHQDGQLHWNAPDWDQNSHGFNFQLQLFGSTAANGVWVLPGSHREGKIDIKALIDANGGSERLPDAVPLICGPGDCFITNRQTLHGSFANTSADKRITVNFGFHKYASVINQTGVLSGHGKTYDEFYVRQRSRCIPLAVRARAERFPDEDRYCYAPFAAEQDEYRLNEKTRASILADYSERDLGI